MADIQFEIVNIDKKLFNKLFEDLNFRDKLNTKIQALNPLIQSHESWTDKEKELAISLLKSIIEDFEKHN